MKDTRTRAQRNRAVRQEALREQLAGQKHLEHVIEMVGIISDADSQLDNDMLNRYKVAIDTKLKLVGKYLPDLKSTEITGDGGGAVKANVSFTGVSPDAPRD